MRCWAKWVTRAGWPSGVRTQAGRGRHPGDLERAREAAHVADVRLHDVDRRQVDDPLPLPQEAVLLAARHVEVERGAHLRGLLDLPVRAGFLEVPVAVLLEQAADLDRPGRRVAAVAVGEQIHLVAKRAADLGISASVRPGHSSRSWPTSCPTRTLKASKPCLLRRSASRAASSAGSMSRRMLEA